MANERKFKAGQVIYVVDYWGTDKGTQAFEAYAEIVYVNEDKEAFDAVLYGDTYQTYSFKDYGRLFFDKKEEALIAASKLPKPTSIIYQVIGKRVYKKEVLGIRIEDIHNTADLVLCLNRGKDISIKEIGVSLFLNESEARANKK